MLVTVDVADDVGLDVMLVLCGVDRVVVRLDVGVDVAILVTVGV